MSLFQKFVLWIYSTIKRTGLLENPLIKRVFNRCYFLYKQHFEDPFWQLTRNYPDLFQGGHILDIGANIGYTSIVFSRAITPGFLVYAFEPEPDNFMMLRKNLKTHQVIDKIIPIQAAVGETQGQVELLYNPSHHADHRILTETYKKNSVNVGKVFSVPLWSIDSFVTSEIAGEAIKFIKIDVQGYEIPVCFGMEETLNNHPDLIVALEYAPVSLSELGFVPEELLQFFENKGYFLYILSRRGRLEFVSWNAIDKIDNSVKQRGYIDLVFSHRELHTV